MSANDRLPTTKLLTLAAFIFAAGLFSLRAFDTFVAPASEPVGGAVEQELVYLLEPITGPDRIRVSVMGQNPKSVLVMIDGEVASDLRPLRTQIENILVASIGFDLEADRLTISQFPFARGVGGDLTTIEILELSGLAVLSMLLLGVAMAPRETATPPPANFRQSVSSDDIRRQAPPVQTVLAPDTDSQVAATLAETQPRQTADLVRGWMSYRED